MFKQTAAKLRSTGFMFLTTLLSTTTSDASRLAFVGLIGTALSTCMLMYPFKVTHTPIQSTTPPYSKYHTAIFEVPHYLFKVPHHPLQSTTSPSSKYHTTLFEVPHHPLQSTTPPSSKYHTTNLHGTMYGKTKTIELHKT